MSQDPNPDRRELLADLRSACLSADQLSLEYQPRVDLRTGRCVAAEALLRWRHPTLGRLSPATFIPIAESDALIGQLTDWVLDTAMGFAQRLSHLGFAIRISANVSPVNLAVGYVVGRLVELLSNYGVDPSMLELEFTEGALIGDDKRTRQQLNQIRRAGIAVSIDDFGAGYSNLAYLRQVPADAIKIDRSLVMPIGDDHESAVIAKWIVSLARELNLRVVAEGVETAQTYALLREWGCDEAQGYFIAQPQPEGDFLHWLTERGEKPAAR